MTGMYPFNNGAYSNLGGYDFVYHDIRMMPEAFKAGGYATAMFGKWHLGANYPHRPEDRGFDEVVRHGGGGVGQTPDVWDNAYFDDRYYHNGKIEQYKGYCTDVFFDETKRFISECSEKKKPFFVYLSPNAPHGPMLCPEKYWKPYLDKIAKLPAFSDERSLKIGRHLITAIFYGMITNIDENIGELRAFLKEKGLDTDTLLVFAGDNGSAQGCMHSMPECGGARPRCMTAATESRVFCTGRGEAWIRGGTAMRSRRISISYLPSLTGSISRGSGRITNLMGHHWCRSSKNRRACLTGLSLPGSPLNNLSGTEASDHEGEVAAGG